MYIIAGLGNPGKKYEGTRHNMGFMVIDKLAQEYDIAVDKLKYKSLIGEGRIAGQRVILVKPQTFMNLSGEALREITGFYKIDPEELIVIYDDIDIPAGALRIRKKGRAGTHNGMRNIAQHLGHSDFPRIKVGIGRDKGKDLADFVLGTMPPDEKQLTDMATTEAAKAVAAILSEGIEAAMNSYNTKNVKEKKTADMQKKDTETEVKND